VERLVHKPYVSLGVLSTSGAEFDRASISAGARKIDVSRYARHKNRSLCVAPVG
jgi:hypothetical protein